MRLPRRTPRPKPAPAPYVAHPPYGEARAELLARRPAQADESIAGEFGRLRTVVLDIGLDDDLVSVFLLADGTISIYNTGGIHSTGLRGATKVSLAAGAVLEDVRRVFDHFVAVDSLGAVPLPGRGHHQVLAATDDGDFALFEGTNPKRDPVVELAAMGLLLTQVARAAAVEGFDRVEAGEVSYELAPDYRRIRSTLLDWLPPPDELPPGARIASVAVEFGEADTRTVVSLFAFADGSTTLFRSDGRPVKALTGVSGIRAAARGLLDSVEAALSEFAPAGLLPPPQPGRVQFVARARFGEEAEWTELQAIADRSALEDGSHPLAAAYRHATEVLRIAG